MTSSSAIARTFAEPAMQDQFERDGFLAIDLLDPGQVEALRALFDRLDHPVRQGFFATNETDDVRYKREMVSGVREIVADAVRAVLPAHRLIGGYFVVKWPGAASEKGPHLDWSLVDEDHFRSVSVWIPLVDTDDRNGALWCVRGSHHLVGSTQRGSPDFPTRHEVEAAVRHLDPGDMERLDLRAGQAVVYSHQTIHFSGGNLGHLPRPAVNIAAIPAAAELVHYRMTDQGDVERLTVDDSFFESWAWSTDPPAPRRIERVDRVDRLGSPPAATQVDASLLHRIRSRMRRTP